MDKGKIFESDVRVRQEGSCYNVSIFGVDPVGINVGIPITDILSAKHTDLEEFTFNLDTIATGVLVTWAYNLGYETALSSVKKEGVEDVEGVS